MLRHRCIQIWLYRQLARGLLEGLEMSAQHLSLLHCHLTAWIWTLDALDLDANRRKDNTVTMQPQSSQTRQDWRCQLTICHYSNTTSARLWTNQADTTIRHHYKFTKDNTVTMQPMIITNQSGQEMSAQHMSVGHHTGSTTPHHINIHEFAITR